MAGDRGSSGSDDYRADGVSEGARRSDPRAQVGDSVSYVVEKADGTEVEKNSYKEAKTLFDRDGVRLWKRMYYLHRKAYSSDLGQGASDYDEIVESKLKEDEPLVVT